MKTKDVKTLLRAVKRKVSIESTSQDPVEAWDSRKNSEVIDYCVQKGYIDARECTHMQSPYKDFIVLGITAEGHDYLRDSSVIGAIRNRWDTILTAAITAGVTLAVTKVPYRAIAHGIMEHVLQLMH